MTCHCCIAFTFLAAAAIAGAAAVVLLVSTGTNSVTSMFTTEELISFSPPRNVTSQIIGQTPTAQSTRPKPDIGPQGRRIWAAIILSGLSFSGSVCRAAIAVGGTFGTALCAVGSTGTMIASVFILYKVGIVNRSTVD